MKRPIIHLLTSLAILLNLGIGWHSALKADETPSPGPPDVYAVVMPAILVKGVALDSLPEAVLPEYINLDPEVPFTAKASGLPPGLTVAVDGSIRGTPTKLGIYRAKIQVSNRYGTSPEAVWVIQIVNEPQKDFGPGGSFLGIAAPEVYDQIALPQFNRRITRIELEVTPAGAFSGSLMIRQGKRHFAGSLKMNPYDQGERVADVQLKNLLRDTSSVLLRIVQTFRLGFAIGVSVEVSINEFQAVSAPLYPRMKPSKDEQRLLVGRHNIALMDEGEQTSGFGSVFLSRGQNATVIGTLPDGTGFTSSSPLTRSEFYHGKPFMLLGHDGRKDGLLNGAIDFGFDVTSDGPILYGTVGGIQWISPAKKRSTWPDGFEKQLRVEGGLYVPPQGGGLLLSSAVRSSGNARLALTGGLLDGIEYFPQLFTLNSAHRATFPPGSGNPHRTQIDFYAPTGFFTGQFKFAYNLPGPVKSQPTRMVPFRGMIIPSGDGTKIDGRGFFLLPSPPDPNGYPPTTWADSPILTGGVRVYAE